MTTTVKTKATPNKRVEKTESKASDGSKRTTKTTSTRKLDGSVETKTKSKVK